ncbi:MAG: hypothetical protein IJU58_02100 [Clostridia bacterium]|nr:hypothetical protein [Clostridia bacterium]
MKKTSLMNGVTVSVYAAMAVYLMVVLVAFGIWVTGGFRKYTAEAGGLKFDCMAVSIADNAGSANVKVLSDKATTTLNLAYGTIGYSDKSVPIEIKLELRDANNRLLNEDEAIVSIPQKVMLGESFAIDAVLDVDGFNKGGDCYLYAYSMDDMLYANPLHIFVDVPIESASLMYYNINSNLNQNYKRIVETEIEGQQTPLRTTLFYKNAADYANNTNAILPLNRELVTEGQRQIYREKALSCVKGDQFQLYVQVWPERSLNPHKNTNTTSIQSSAILKNVDAQGLSNLCVLLSDGYANATGDDESLQNYVDQFAKIWPQIGLNDYINLNGLINKNKISQAVNRIKDITAIDVTNYYNRTFGSTIVFDDKAIIYETPRRDVAEVDEATEILTIKSDPTLASDASVNVNISPIYDNTLAGATIFKAFTEETAVVDVEINSDFEVGTVYYIGLGFDEGITKANISSQLVTVLNVSQNRLVLSAQELSDQDKTLLRESANALTQTELQKAVNLGIVINTKGNNKESNPTPLISEMKNLNLVQVVENSSNPDMLPLSIVADNTTLGDTNKIWIISANRRLATESNESLSLTISLTQEIKVSELEAPDIDEGGNLPDEAYVIDEYECENSLAYKPTDNTIAQKTSSIKGLVFDLKIEKPTNMQFSRTVNMEFTKYDDGRNKDFTPISLSSLMTTYNEQNPYIAENYTYGKIIYFVDDTSSEVVNTTASGLLYYSYADASASEDVKYGYIEPMGAGSVSITPYLVMTERVDGVEYAIKYDTTENKYVHINLAEAAESDFVIIDTYNTINVKVTERIVSFTYYLDDTLTTVCPKNDPNRYFATGANNKVLLYVRANSAKALPASATEYQGLGYSYSYSVTTNGQSTSDLSIGYPEDSEQNSKRFVSLQINVGEEQLLVNCMVIEITIQPLKSLDNKVYTITWYKGNEEILDSQISINAKDYFGDQNSLSFKKESVKTQQDKTYTAQFVKDNNTEASMSRYVVEWKSDETQDKTLPLPDVYYLPTNNSTASLPYVQTTLYPSEPTTTTVFYWIKDPVFDAEGHATYTYETLNVSNTYFAITETTSSVGEGDDITTETITTLYIKDIIPSTALGVRIGYRNNPGVQTGNVIECYYDIFLEWPIIEETAMGSFVVRDENKIDVTLSPLATKTNTLIDYNVILDLVNSTIIVPLESSVNYAINDIIRIYEGSTLLIEKAKIASIETTAEYVLLHLEDNTLSNIELNATKQCHVYKLTEDTQFVTNNVLLPAWAVNTTGISMPPAAGENYLYTLTADASVNLTNLTTIQFYRTLDLRFKIPTSGNGYSDKHNYSKAITSTKQTS